MERIKIYGNVKEEQAVVMLFAKIHERLGFTKFVPASSRGLDIYDIEYEENGIKERVSIEFEYVSSNFIAHNHMAQLEENRKCVVVCWKDDIALVSTLKDYNIKVIELYKYFEVIPDDKVINDESIKYHVLTYKKEEAGNFDFKDFKNVSLYRCSSRMGKDISRGDKILIKSKNYILGGFDVINYFDIKKPKTEREWDIYTKLTYYPTTLFFSSKSEIEEMYNDSDTYGHIYFNNFFYFDNPSIQKTIDSLVPEIKMRPPKYIINEKQYYTLVGNHQSIKKEDIK